MAQRTQIRMGALSGTFGTADGAISDQETAAATGSISADGLDDILSHVASSIKRLHGHTSFSANAAGTFYTDVLPSADNTHDLGSAVLAWQDLHLQGDVLMTDAGKIATAAGALTLDSGAAILLEPAAGSNVLIDGAVAIDAGVVTGVTSLTATAIDGVIGGDTARAGSFTAVIGTTGVYSGILKTDDATEATSTTDGSLQTDGGLSVAKSAVIGDDLDLLSNSAILKVGADQPFTLTHANANNTLLASANHRLALGDAGEYIMGDGTDMKIMSSGDVDITATLVDVTGALTVSGLTTATGRVIVDDATDATSKTDGSLQTDGGLSVAKKAYVGTGLTVEAGGAHLTAGRLTIDDATEATSATDGSLQTDGGLSVAKSAVIGDDLDLLSNSAILKMGVAQPFTVTHANANNTATISASHRLAFGDAGDYIIGDGTDLEIVASNEFDITAAAAVEIEGGAASEFKTTVGTLTLKAEQNHANGKVVLSGSSGADSVHIQSDATVGGALVVSGDLTINGTTTTVASTVATIADPLIVLGQGNSTDTKDLGLVFVRSSNNMWMGFDESDDYFKVADVGSEDGTTSGNISSVTPTNMMVGKLAVDSSANYLDVTSSDLTATAGQDFVVDAARDIILDAAGNDVMFKANGTQFLKLTNNSGDVEIFNGVADKDILFKDLAGNEVFRMDGSAESLLMASSKRLQLGAAEEALYGDGTDIHFEVGANGDINIPADIGLTFGDDGERIEGDGTDLSVYGNIINLIPTTDVVLPNDKGIVFGGAGEKIEGDGSKLVIAAANLDLTMEAGGDVVLPNNIGMVFGDAAEKIEGDGTKLVIASSADIDLTAATDVVLPVNVGMVFGDAGEKIEGNGQRLAIQSGVGMMLDAEGTIIIDSDNGIVTFEDGGVNHGAIAMTGGAYVIAANKTMVLSSSQGVVEYNDDGVSYLRILKSGNDTIISSSIDNGDIKFHADDDTEVFKIDGAEKAAIFGSGRKLAFADTGEYISGDGTHLTLGSGGEIRLLATTDISFDANGGDFVFADDASVGMSIDIDAAAGDALFKDAGGTEIFRIDGSANSLLMAGTNRIDFNDAGTTINSSENGELNLTSDGSMVDSVKLNASAGGIYLNAALDGSAVAIHLDSASGVTIAGGDQNDSVYIENSPLQLEAISAPSSTANKMYNIGGALYWNGNAISDTSQKQVFKLAAAVNAGSNISGDAGASAFDLSNIVTANHLKKVDVFVNGQMMVSGSETERAASTADYHMIGTRAGGNDNAVELQFGFGLEAEDVVQVSVK